MRTHLIYGSTAIKHWFKDFREPRDIDIITKQDIKNVNEKGIKIEFYWTDAFEYILKNNKDIQFVDKDFLFTIKVSHASWDINWEKTMKDIEFLKSMGCKLDKELYNLLYSDWEKLHGKKKVKMDVPNTEFFKENIYRKYNHDWLHQQFAYDERPMNELIRKDLSSPLCSEELWNKLNYSQKLMVALEEIMVLSAERFIFIDKPYPLKIARLKTLKMMITSTTSGWFNLFLIIHFDSLRILGFTHFKERLEKIKDIENG